jgi:ABC-type antimicrobial peptide transport system permease subunit
VATHSPAPAAVNAVRDVLSARFPGAARLDVNTGRELIALDLARERLSARLLSGFGLIALTLGIVGTYGLVRHAVGLRWRDLGIRMSLGADARTLSWQMVRHGLQPIVLGIVCGALASGIAAAAARAVVLGLASPGATPYVLAALVLFSGASAAAVLGVRRIRSLTPSRVLRAP